MKKFKQPKEKKKKKSNSWGVNGNLRQEVNVEIVIVEDELEVKKVVFFSYK